MSRIRLQDTLIDGLVKLAEGNPGAARVLGDLASKENGLGFVHCCKLDAYGIYGSRIWMCYKDLCGEDIEKLYSLLQKNELKAAIKMKCDENDLFRMEWEYYANSTRERKETG